MATIVLGLSWLPTSSNLEIEAFVQSNRTC
jgi:hypothetical protein